MRERQNKTKEMLYLCIVIALIPYSFIALYCDAMMKNVSMIGYGFALFCVMVLLKTVHTIKERFLVFCLSICSLLESYFLTRHFLGEEWNYYFKPFTASDIVLGIMILFLMVQFVILVSQIKRKKL
ncbi:hypothetical protein [Filifactor alocis]